MCQPVTRQASPIGTFVVEPNVAVFPSLLSWTLAVTGIFFPEPRHSTVYVTTGRMLNCGAPVQRLP